MASDSPVSSLTASQCSRPRRRPTGYVSHRVRPGETLQDIARHYCGDDALWMDIYRANTDVLDSPYDLPTNQVLSVPLFDDPELEDSEDDDVGSA